MNRYTVRIKSTLDRVSDVTIAADGYSETFSTVKFWKRRWYFFRQTLHSFAKFRVISIIGDRGNE